MKTLVTATVAVVLLVAGCGADGGSSATGTTASSTPSGFKVQGVVSVSAGKTVPGQTEYTDGGDCVLGGGYDDIRQGAQVTVKDQSGNVVALGALDAGHIQRQRCQFGFTVENVPDGKDFYSVEVSHRGELKYTRDGLNQALALTLGD